jgi:hypothetical protein
MEKCVDHKILTGKRVIFSLAWGILFFLAALFLYGMGVGFLSGVVLYYIQGISKSCEQLMIGTLALMAVVSLVAALLGVGLGLAGKLPGTKK